MVLKDSKDWHCCFISTRFLSAVSIVEAGCLIPANTVSKNVSGKVNDVSYCNILAVRTGASTLVYACHELTTCDFKFTCFLMTELRDVKVFIFQSIINHKHVKCVKENK